MKVFALLRLAFRNTTRYKKQNALIIFLMTLAEIIIIFTISISSSINNFFNINTANNIEFRRIFVSYDTGRYTEPKMIAMLNSLAHVVATVPQSSLLESGKCASLSNKLGDNNGYIQLNGGNNRTVPDTISGRKIRNGETNVGVIPSEFYPDSRIADPNLKKNSPPLNGRSYIGSSLTIHFDKYDYTFKVVGVYDSSKYPQTNCDVFIPYADVNKIYQATQPASSDTSDSSLSTISSIVAVADNYGNLNSITNILQQKGFQVTTTKVNTELGVLINLIGGALSAVVLLISFVTILLNKLNATRDRAQEIGLMKAIGYNNRQVVFLLNYETVITGVISFLISALIGSYGFLSIVSYFSHKDNEIPLSLSPFSYLITILISLLVPLLATLAAGFKSTHIPPSAAMKE